MIFRGVLYQIVETSIGTWWALGLSSLIFGEIHLTSPASTVLSTIGVLATGVLFAGAFSDATVMAGNRDPCRLGLCE